ncbi:hypothetical protein D6C97_10554 [Aureobasidium pullulans]|nr:hypothetical protein D6C97_10554 [Aureobasidium pullulans]
MLNLDLTRFERESVARLREEEARYKGVSKIIAFLIPRRPLYTRSASGVYGSSSRYEPGTLRNPFPSPRSYVRRIPTSRNKEDPTLMSRGAGGPVNPTSNASSPYRRRNFEATTEAKRLINAKELIEEERRAAERSRYLSYGDPPIFDLRSLSRSRSPSPNFLASYPAAKIDTYNASYEPGMSKVY